MLSTEILNLKTVRSGVIPFTFFNDHFRFCLAKDRKTGELGDFGGGVKKGEDSITGGIRELEEESNGIFCDIDIDYAIGNGLPLLDDNRRKMAIFLVYVEPPMISQSRVNFKPSDEISDIVWVTEEELYVLIYNRDCNKGVMWKKISSFLKVACGPKKRFTDYLQDTVFSIYNKRHLDFMNNILTV
jgi:hypothetical protein